MSEIQPRITRTDNGTKRLATTLAPAISAASGSTSVSANPQAKRTAKRRAVLIGVLAIATFVYVGGQRRAIGPSAGVLDVRAVVSAVPADQPAKLRIGTYNIHMGKGTDGRTDLSRIAGVIGGLDFVGLNEVLGAAPWEQEDQAATLGRELKMTSLYTPTETRWWTAKFGNGFLSKLDVRSWQVVPLARRHGKSFRNLVHIRAKAANGTPLNVVVTHIDRSDDRERHEQLKTVGEYFLSLQMPAILLGDMNSDAHDPVMVKLLEGTDIVDALGKAKGFNAPRHIDWILTRGLEVKDAGMSPVGPSDHAHVWAELEVPARDAKTAARRAWDIPIDLEMAMSSKASGSKSEDDAARAIARAKASPFQNAESRSAVLLIYPRTELPTPPVVTVVDSLKGPSFASSGAWSTWTIGEHFLRAPEGSYSHRAGGSFEIKKTSLLEDGTSWGRFSAQSQPEPDRDAGFAMGLRR
jgi:endonuclease/exonuclease/phosphatase family metal-dependent hydrolase